MNPATLAFQLEWTQRTIGVNTEGVTHEESLVRPGSGGNCINWVLGHIVVHRGVMLTLLGQPPFWSDEEAEVYRRGSSGDLPASRLKPLDALRADLESSSTRLRAAMAAADDTVLRSPAPSGKLTVGERLAFLVFHEAYHTGQIGLLRRLAGRPGAIR